MGNSGEALSAGDPNCTLVSEVGKTDSRKREEESTGDVTNRVCHISYDLFNEVCFASPTFRGRQLVACECRVSEPLENRKDDQGGNVLIAYQKSH